MLELNQLIGFGVGGRGNLTITTTYFASKTANETVRTWTAVDIGAEFPTRYVVVATRTQVSVTINGISATDLGSGVFWGAYVPTGTSVTVVTTASGSTDRAALGVYTLTGVEVLTVDSVETQSSLSTYTFNVFIPTGCVVLGYWFSGNTADCTWTNLTENYDQTVESAARYAYASDSFSTSEASRTISATNGVTSGGASLIVLRNA